MSPIGSVTRRGWSRRTDRVPASAFNRFGHRCRGAARQHKIGSGIAVEGQPPTKTIKSAARAPARWAAHGRPGARTWCRAAAPVSTAMARAQPALRAIRRSAGVSPTTITSSGRRPRAAQKASAMPGPGFSPWPASAPMTKSSWLGDAEMAGVGVGDGGVVHGGDAQHQAARAQPAEQRRKVAHRPAAGSGRGRRNGAARPRARRGGRRSRAWRTRPRRCPRCWPRAAGCRRRSASVATS